MNIVWLTPEIPYPPIGGRNGVYNRIVQLSRYNNIYLFSIAYSDDELSLSSAMEPYCKEVHYYNRNLNKLLVLCKSMFMPFSVASRAIPQLRADLQGIITNNHIDAIIVDFPNMAKNILDIVPNGVYCSLNQHNIEYKRMREMVEIKTISYIKRILYFIESFRLQIYEKNLYNRNIFNSITFFSKDDLAFFAGKWKKCQSELMLFPLGANEQESIKHFDDNHVLLFIGRLDEVAVPNVEAVNWLCDMVFPIIMKELPDVKLIIAGANPCSNIKKYEQKNITIIANYSNLEDVYNLSDCVVLPLQSGGGVKGKLLEAAAFSKLIISTSHGIEGTEFKDNTHVLLADDPNLFAEKCLYALKNKKECLPIAQNANKLFSELYDWKSIGKTYNNFINSRLLN